MTKFMLVIVIALGVLLGQIAWELLGLLVEWSGKLVGWVIAQSMQRMIAARQAEAERNAAALARQRPPLVTETGGRVDETLQR
jgi:hypothetical protein